MTKLTKLETKVLEAFSKRFPEHLGSEINFDTIENCERSFSGKGFMTELPNIPKLHTKEHVDKLVWDEATAIVNESIVVGFLVFLEEGRLSAVEGFTFGENWPDEISIFQMEND